MAEEDAIRSLGQSREMGLRSAVLREVKEKLFKDLQERQREAEVQVLNNHKVSFEHYEYSLGYYLSGTTKLLEQEGYGPI
mmetsp:Transcript_492/g.965  ORF Transcript_492/g.965 Transcript_492/m.965 type:complete len:80 (+) Transcript_492:274-513(+)